MATTANDTELPTLLDLMKMQDPDGTEAKIIEILTQKTSLLQDAVWQEGNLATGHRVTSEMALPPVGFRRFNAGVEAGKGQDRQWDEPAAIIEGRSEVDVALARLNGNEAAYRFSRDRKFLRAMKHQLESSILYANAETSPDQFQGVMPRYDLTTGEAGSQIILHTGGAGGNDQNSILLINWGPESAFLFYPKGSKGGLTPDDMGKQQVEDADGNKFRAWVTYWEWQVGLCVANREQVVRIANIDTSAGLDATDTDIIDTMIQAYHKLQDPEAGRPVYYVNRTIATYLHLQAKNSVANSTLSIENVGGKPVTMFLGVPVRTSDGMTSTEGVVS